MNMPTTILNIPPQAVEAEQAILGGLMLDNEKLDDIFDFLERKHFYTHAHQSIFDSMARLAQEGQAVDLVTLRNKLDHDGKLETIGGLSYLDSIMNNTPGTSNMMTYAQIVYDKSIERDMVLVGGGVQDLLREQLTTQEKLDKFESQIGRISDKKNITGPVRVDACIGSALDEIEIRSNSDGPIGLSSGLIDLDAYIGGFEAGDVVVLAGTPGAGKTSFAMNVMEHQVLREKKTGAVFSLEMPKQQLLWRSMSTISNVDFFAIKNGKLKDDQFSLVSAAGRKLAGANLFIDDEGGLSVLQIRSRARKVHRNNPLDFIVIDYLQLMSGEGRDANERIEKITPQIKSLAKELNIPIFLLSQLSRASVKEGRRPNMSDLRSSGAIEQDADVILFLYNCEGIDHPMPRVDFIVGKQRNGPTGTVGTTFEKRILKFRNGARAIDITQQSKPRRNGFD